ncbi:MAG: hypothetical protein RMK29_07085 [Myxococcales bacterium]|nr:hypothetical protein [Myxococcota bacterium]MDW8281458.1 hypothetical protein [Myxococcales bacterium]
MQPRLCAFLTLLVVAMSGCPARERAGDEPAEQKKEGRLTVTPAEAVLDVDGKNSASISFRVLRGDEDVTDQASLWVDDARLGSFSGATFTSVPGAAGRTTVRAQLEGDTGSASLLLRVRAVVIAPGAPPDAPDRFGGAADPSRAPELVYPPNGVLVPPNIQMLEFQWHKRTATLFELSLVGEALDLRIYTPCASVGSGCGLIPDEATWKLLQQVARGRTVKWAVRGTADGGGTGTSGSFDLSFSEEDMRGGIYYWAAGAGSIMRYDFGLRRQRAEAFYTPLQAVATCVGCHALSRNGKRIAVGMNIPGPAMMRVLEVATRTKLFEVGMGVPLGDGSDYQAFTPDGSRLITVEKGGLSIRNGADGALIGTRPALPNANMPDVSPDGKQVVFARGSCPVVLCPTLQVENAALLLVPFANDTFGMPVELVPKAAGQNNYYPSFSPDGRLVVFNRSGGTSYDAPDARVMIVPTAGGQPIDLAAVNAQLGNSWPKWSPFQHRFRGATIFWLTFSSRRPYGLRQPSAAQLWMVAVDAGRLVRGEDGGFPPFWLPFQDPGTGNHIAQWVEVVDRAPCSDLDRSQCQPNELCVQGMCVPGLQ